MAINKKLPVGSILFTYHEPRYDRYSHARKQGKYTISFKILYIHNRRERSSGVTVPDSLVPTLNKLGIKHEKSHEKNSVTAIGCRFCVYHSCKSDSPYPSAEEIKEARTILEETLERDTVTNEGVSLMEIDFVKDFKEKEMTNKDSIFSLSMALSDYVTNEAVIN